MNYIKSNFRGLFGKALAMGFLTMVMAGATFAQVGTLFYGNGARFGTIEAFPTVWRVLPDGGGEIKIYSCSGIGGGGLGCVFTQFNCEGRTSYSGNAQVFQSGAVNMQYKFDFTSGFQQNTNGELNLQVK